MDISDRFVIVQDVISTEMDGEIVLMHVPKGKYYALNETGSLIWQILEKEEASLQDLISLFTKEYEVDEVICRGDLERIINSMVEQGVLEKKV